MMDSVYGGMSIRFLWGAAEEVTGLTFHCSLTPARCAVQLRSSVAAGPMG